MGLMLIAVMASAAASPANGCVSSAAIERSKRQQHT
tara:strand:+ start:15138 stop:15245 length:108 start_codon:yes stop_codon:yes gene_type:complete